MNKPTPTLEPDGYPHPRARGWAYGLIEPGSDGWERVRGRPWFFFDCGRLWDSRALRFYPGAVPFGPGRAAVQVTADKVREMREEFEAWARIVRAGLEGDMDAPYGEEEVEVRQSDLEVLELLLGLRRPSFEQQHH